MTSAGRRAALQEYFEQLRDLMRLQAWEVYVSDTPAESDDHMLNIQCDVKTHWARIRVGQFFETENEDVVNSPDIQRRAVVHELVHCWQADLSYWLAEGGWKLPLAPDNAAAIEEFVHLQIEVQADAISRVLAPFMPMPPDWGVA